MSDLTPVFLDTAYVFALINTRDEWHAKARELGHTLHATSRPLVTSEFVLAEIADGLSAIRFRASQAIGYFSHETGAQWGSALLSACLVLLF